MDNGVRDHRPADRTIPIKAARTGGRCPITGTTVLACESWRAIISGLLPSLSRRAGRGSEAGSPLVHRIYAPDHHSDTVFILAVQHGVRGHHWGTRNMPPQPELDAPTIENIIAYIRELQRANGIH